MTEPTSLIAYQLAEREIVANGWAGALASRGYAIGVRGVGGRTLEKRPTMVAPPSRSGA